MVTISDLLYLVLWMCVCERLNTVDSLTMFRKEEAVRMRAETKKKPRCLQLRQFRLYYTQFLILLFAATPWSMLEFHAGHVQPVSQQVFAEKIRNQAGEQQAKIHDSSSLCLLYFITSLNS